MKRNLTFTSVPMQGLSALEARVNTRQSAIAHESRSEKPQTYKIEEAALETSAVWTLTLAINAGRDSHSPAFTEIALDKPVCPVLLV